MAVIPEYSEVRLSRTI